MALIYRAYYAVHLVDQSRLYPGAVAVLTHFSARRQAVITNKPEPFSRDILRALGIEAFFCQIVGGDSDYPKKPDPASIRAVMETWGALPAETLFIGDSPIDIETGRNAGVLTVGVTHGFSDEDELRRLYFILWDSINKKKGFRVEDAPGVSCIEFERHGKAWNNDTG